MKNIEISKIFFEMADILEIRGVKFKPWAYRKAARSIQTLTEDIEEVHRRGELDKIPGVGESLRKKIIEYIETGKLKSYEKMKKTIPFDLEGMNRVPGMGPKKAYKLYKELGVKNLKGLERAAGQGRIREIEGFGEKTEKNILEGINFAKQTKNRMLLGFALPTAGKIVEEIRNLGHVTRTSLAGSIRRRRETIGDVDILASSKRPKELTDFFTKMKDVKKILAKGPTKSSVLLKSGMQVDLRVVDEKCFGSALQYFTGSKEHNIALRKIAIKKGYKLSEYGVFSKRTGRLVAGKTEEEVYKKLGLCYVPPELRENRGELKKKFPKNMIGYDDLKGDLHLHTRFSDGSHTVQEMASAAAKKGYEYIAITDHAGRMKIAGAQSEKELLKNAKHIRKTRFPLHVFVGAEVDILKNGTLSISNKVLSQLDMVVAGVHSKFKMSEGEMTRRLISAMECEHVDIIAHPTGRLINKREPYKVDLDALFLVSKRTGTFLEMNSFPQRLDLSDEAARRAVQKGLRLAINTDAHSKEHLWYARLGIAQARRAWLRKKDIINTLPLKKLKKLIHIE